MKQTGSILKRASFGPRVRGWMRWLPVWNLNDPRWGRQDDEGAAAPAPGASAPDDAPAAPPHAQSPAPRPRTHQTGNSGPPDLDELWRDFNRKLSGLFSGRSGGGSSGPKAPNPKAAGVGMGLVAAVATLIWLGTGFFIVQEGEEAVITQFGRYHSTVKAGFQWRLPYPIQGHSTVSTVLRSVDVGGDQIVPATGLRDSSMLTEDENIVDIKFVVQYRISDTRAFLFQSRDPEVAVKKAAETAVREVVGKMRMDAALAEERDQIAPRVRRLTQDILDRYQVGIEVVAINLQQGGVRPPEQVQAAFDDVLKAGQERERSKNEAQAYANDVVPKARGAAARLMEEAEGYRSRIVAQAQGDAQRFKSVHAEYQKAPQVTRERMYTDTMKEVYSNVSKVLVESRQGSNLLYLPLDKLMRASEGHPVAEAPAPATPATAAPAPAVRNDSGNAAAARLRQRDSR